MNKKAVFHECKRLKARDESYLVLEHETLFMDKKSRNFNITIYDFCPFCGERIKFKKEEPKKETLKRCLNCDFFNNTGEEYGFCDNFGQPNKHEMETCSDFVEKEKGKR